MEVLIGRARRPTFALLFPVFHPMKDTDTCLPCMPPESASVTQKLQKNAALLPQTCGIVHCACRRDRRRRHGPCFERTFWRAKGRTEVNQPCRSYPLILLIPSHMGRCKIGRAH